MFAEPNLPSDSPGNSVPPPVPVPPSNETPPALPVKEAGSPVTEQAAQVAPVTLPAPPKISPEKPETDVASWDTFGRVVWTEAVNGRFDGVKTLLSTLLVGDKVVGPEAVKRIVNYRDPATDLTLLHKLCLDGASAEVISLALRLGAKVNASASYRVEISSEPLKNGTRDRIDYFTPLHAACMARSHGAVEVLLKEGANLHGASSLGETPLSVLFTEAITENTLAIAELLLERGARVTGRDRSWRTPMARALEYGSAPAVDLLARYYERSLEKLPHLRDDLKLDFGNLLHELPSRTSLGTPRGKSWSDVEFVLDAVKRHEVLLGGTDGVKEIFSRAYYHDSIPQIEPFSGTSSPLHQLCAYGAPTGILEKAIALGANVNQPAGGPSGKKNRPTALHCAAIRKDLQTLEFLLQHGADPNARDGSGRTPLLLLFERLSFPGRTEAIRKLLAAGANINATDRERNSCLGYAFRDGDVEGVKLVIESGFNLIRTPEGGMVELSRRGKTKKIPTADFMVEMTETATRLPLAARYDMLRILRQGASYAHLDLYARAFAAARNRGSAHDQLALTRLLPHLLFTYKPGTITGLVRSIENYMDLHPWRWGHHRNEAEMLLLLNHPRSNPDAGLDRIWLTTSLTSITRFLYRGVPKLTGATLDNWARIGALSFSFQFWRYDAVRAALTGAASGSSPSLLEEYGFTPAGKRRTDETRGIFPFRSPGYGTGFLIRPGTKSFAYPVRTPQGEKEIRGFDERTFIEFRRGYLLVSHPSYGTLVIRNSSPEFGRDTMKHPAYWSRKAIGHGYTEKDLLAFDQKMLNRDFRHLLAVHNYFHGGELFDSHLRNLIELVTAVKNDYAAWKFDTRPETAWLDLGEFAGVHLTGGFHSPGFSPLIDRLKQLAAAADAAGKPRPELAFARPDLPPWVPHRYRDGAGKQVARLKVTDEALEVFGKLATGTANDTDLNRTGIRNFFQDAGFSKRGELVILAPES